MPIGQYDSLIIVYLVIGEPLMLMKIICTSYLIAQWSQWSVNDKNELDIESETFHCHRPNILILAHQMCGGHYFQCCSAPQLLNLIDQQPTICVLGMFQRKCSSHRTEIVPIFRLHGKFTWQASFASPTAPCKYNASTCLLHMQTIIHKVYFNESIFRVTLPIIYERM